HANAILIDLDFLGDADNYASNSSSRMKLGAERQAKLQGISTHPIGRAKWPDERPCPPGRAPFATGPIARAALAKFATRPSAFRAWNPLFGAEWLSYSPHHHEAEFTRIPRFANEHHASEFWRI